MRHWCAGATVPGELATELQSAAVPPWCVLSSASEEKTPEVPVSRIGLFAALAISIGALAPLGAHAQDDVRKRGDRACGGDSRRMCTKFFQGGDMAILGCLQQNKVRLSGSCRKFLTGIGQLQ
jgi:hypothetical protein